MVAFRVGVFEVIGTQGQQRFRGFQQEVCRDSTRHCFSSDRTGNRVSVIATGVEVTLRITSVEAVHVVYQPTREEVSVPHPMRNVVPCNLLTEHQVLIAPPLCLDETTNPEPSLLHVCHNPTPEAQSRTNESGSVSLEDRTSSTVMTSVGAVLTTPS